MPLLLTENFFIAQEREAREGDIEKRKWYGGEEERRVCLSLQ